MRRSGFLGLVVGSVALVAFQAADNGCASNSAGLTVDAGYVSTAAFDDYIHMLATRCLGTIIPPGGNYDPLSSDVLLAARDAYAAGQEDIALSPSGCTRMLVEHQNGAVIDVAIVGPPFNQPSGGNGKYVAALTAWSYETAGTELFIADADADGFFETLGNIQYGKQSIFEVQAPGTNAVLARTTAVVSSDGRTLQVTKEDSSSGTLATVATFVAPVSQASCLPSAPKPTPSNPNSKQPADVNTRGCSEAEKTAISNAIATAATQGSGCLWAAGDRKKSDALLHAFVDNEFKVECTDDTSGGFVAANDRGYSNLFPGMARLIIQSAFFGSGQSDAFRSGTLMHELLHFIDVHDPDLEAAADEDHLRLSDPVYACEYACSGAGATVCHLAACLGKTTDTSWMGNMCKGTLDSTTISNVEKARGMPLGGCSSNQQVGALCHNSNFGQEVLFCTTEMECNNMCGSSCDSKSLSCDQSCR